MYEHVGSIKNEDGHNLIIYTRVEKKGYKSKQGRTIKEYGVSVSKIEDNWFYNKENIETKPEVMRAEMQRARTALIKAVAQMNKEDKHKPLIPVCKA